MTYNIEAYGLLIGLSITAMCSLYNGQSHYHHPIMLQMCPTINGSGLNVTWGPTEHGKCAVSHPICADETWRAATRCCSARGWNREPACRRIQEPPAPCPAEYQYHVGKELCYRLTEPTTFPPQCGNQDTVPFNDYQQILDEGVTDKVWMPVTRDYSNGIGYPVWTELSDNYKVMFDASSTHNKFYLKKFTKDCFVYSKGIVQNVPCQEKHKGICAYSKLENINSYCKRKCGLCRSKHYVNHTQCFCVHYMPAVGNEPNAADLLHPFQNLIIKSLTSDDCYIGLQKTNDGFFRWSKSKEKINYSYWSPDVNYSPENKYGLLTHNGWVLTSRTNDTRCVIYDQNVPIQEPRLILSFKNEDQIFKLDLVNADDLKQFDVANNQTVYCFTDVTQLYLTYRLPSLNLTGHSITFEPLDAGPGHYWCEAVKYSTFDVVRSNTVLYDPRDKFGCEYVVIVMCYGSDTALTFDFIVDIQKQYSSNFTDYSVRIFKIVPVDTFRNESKLNMHFTHKNSNSSVYSVNTCTSEYGSLRNRLTQIESKCASVEDVFSTSHCIAEKDMFGIQWPTIGINTATFPKTLCLSQIGTLVKRHCSGNFTDGARWEPLYEKCETYNDTITEDLYTLLISNITSAEMVDGLYNITKEYRAFSTLDIFLIGGIVSKIAEELSTNCLAKLLNVTSLLNHLDRKTLKDSQATFNATDHILHGLDDIFSKIRLPAANPKVSLHSENTLLNAVDISRVNISGVVLYKYGSTYDLDYLDVTDNLSRIVEAPTFQSAVVLPEKLKRQIVDSKQSDNKLVFAVYVMDSLFNSASNDSNSLKKISQIFNVLIPNFDEPFVEPLEIIFKTTDMTDLKSCAHWSFLKVKGTWKNDSNSLPITSGVKCAFWHVTHFALLFLENPDGVINFNQVLDLITDVNCVLSLLGLLFILLTAVLFKRWRTNTGNKILINFVFAIAFQISLLYISDLVYRFVKVNDICTIVGAMLHYSIISEFCWMLIVAILQFKRFVEVLGGQPKYIMLKACVVGWILPLFPVLCVLFLDPKSYVRNSVGLCYPSGISLYLSIWLPVGIIVAINFVIFTYILYSVATKNTDCLIGSKESYYQWRLAVLLFFMLGLTWSFGLLIQLDFGILFVYLFTFSATLQGFVMFLFFIIFNKNTRILYMQYMRNCFYPHK